MKQLLFCVLLIACVRIEAQTKMDLIYTCDKYIPSYYVVPETQKASINNSKGKDSVIILKELLKLNDETTVMLADTLTDIAGGFHETYQQYYKGLEVDGRRCVIHYDQDGYTKLINGDLKTIQGLSVDPTVSMTEAKHHALIFLKKDLYRCLRQTEKGIEEIDIDSVASIRQEKFVIYIKDDVPYLAYRFGVSSLLPELNQIVYIDAFNGEVIDAKSTLCAISANAVSLYSDTVTIETEYVSGAYRLRDNTRGEGIETYAFTGAPISPSGGGFVYASSYGDDYTSYDNTWANLSQTDRASIDVHWGVEKTYDY